MYPVTSFVLHGVRAQRSEGYNENTSVCVRVIREGWYYYVEQELRADQYSNVVAVEGSSD